ncbi:MAG: PRC-barrel domain-containing protein, partial [Terriglobia bacterium]
DRAVDSADSHLRSANEVIGYEIMASDGPIGGVKNLFFDDESWAILHIAVDTRKWLPGKHVLLSPESIERISWLDHEMSVNMTRHAVETSPHYDPSRPPLREHEGAGGKDRPRRTGRVT